MTVQTEQTTAALTQPTTPQPAPVNEQALTGWAQVLGHGIVDADERRP